MSKSTLLFTTLFAGSLCLSAFANQSLQYKSAEAPIRNAISVAQANESQPTFTTKSVKPLREDDGREYTTLLEEDFSLCTAGATDNPDVNYIENNYYEIPSQYTHTPGWGGRAVMQAGGAICLGKFTDQYSGEEITGYIDLPELDLHRDYGTAYVSFRAKLLSGDYDMVNVRWTATTDFLPETSEAVTSYVNGFGWTTIEVTLTECPENAVIQIFSETTELLIDDIKVEQFQPEIDAPTALKWTDFTGDSFTANWSAVDGADHYIFNCFYIRRQGSEDQLPSYKYIARDVETTETSYHLSGLDRTKTYYYYVRAVNADGVKSEESACVEVLDLCVPSGIKVDEVTKESFTVSWDPVFNAEGYGFQAVLDHTAQMNEDYALIDEPFDGVECAGSIGDVYTNNIGLYDMDSYGMTRANWVMYEGGVIDGAIALHNYVSSYGTQYYGELVSPIMSIGQTTGEVTIEADFATLDKGVKPYLQIAVPGVVDGQTQWTLGGGGEINAVIGSTWSHVKRTYQVKPGLIRFSIGCTDGGWLYVDNLRISVKMDAGASQRVLYRYDEIKDNIDAPSYTCKTTDRQAGDEYSFALMAARQRPGSYMIPTYILSEWSPLTQVPSLPYDEDGVDSITAEATAFTATGANGAIEISNPSGVEIVVLDMAGRAVAHTNDASASIAVAPGLYIVSGAVNGTVKVIVK